MELGVCEEDDSLPFRGHPALQVHQHQLPTGLDVGEVSQRCGQVAASSVGAAVEVVVDLREATIAVRLDVQPLLDLT